MLVNLVRVFLRLLVHLEMRVLNNHLLSPLFLLTVRLF